MGNGIENLIGRASILLFDSLRGKKRLAMKTGNCLLLLSCVWGQTDSLVTQPGKAHGRDSSLSMVLFGGSSVSKIPTPSNRYVVAATIAFSNFARRACPLLISSLCVHA